MGVGGTATKIDKAIVIIHFACKTLGLVTTIIQHFPALLQATAIKYHYRPFCFKSNNERQDRVSDLHVKTSSSVATDLHCLRCRSPKNCNQQAIIPPQNVVFPYRGCQQPCEENPSLKINRKRSEPFRCKTETSKA